jgi:hypothetical protein
MYKQVHIQYSRFSNWKLQVYTKQHFDDSLAPTAHLPTRHDMRPYTPEIILPILNKFFFPCTLASCSNGARGSWITPPPPPPIPPIPPSAPETPPTGVPPTGELASLDEGEADDADA